MLNQETLSKSDNDGLNCKVGFVTNVSSTYHAMLSDYSVGSQEREMIEIRLAALRREQGNTIDAGKGIIVDPFPEHWTKFQKIEEDLEDFEKEEISLENMIMVEKRPLFFYTLYPDYRKKYQKEIDNYDSYAKMKWGISFEDLVSKKDRTEEQEKILKEYYKFSFFIHNDCVMNKIMRHLDKEIKEIKFETSKLKFDFSRYIDDDIFIDYDKLVLLERFYEEYTNQRIIVRNNESDFSTIEQYIANLRKRIFTIVSSDVRELANLSVVITYQYGKNKEFAWKVFGDGICENLLKNNNNSVSIPVENKDGSLQYLYKNYEISRYRL